MSVGVVVEADADKEVTGERFIAVNYRAPTMGVFRYSLGCLLTDDFTVAGTYLPEACMTWNKAEGGSFLAYQAVQLGTLDL